MIRVIPILNAKARFAGRICALHSKSWLEMETIVAIIGNAVHSLVKKAYAKQKMVLYATVMKNVIQAVVTNFALA
jgi:hypothetical protein